jgi:hypothetical protein
MSSTTASNSILTDSVNAITATTGSISIGASQTSGILNIGTNIGRTSTGAINIGDTANLGKINIQTANVGNSNADPAVNIATGTSAKWIKIGSSTALATGAVVSLGNLKVNTVTSGIEINGNTAETTENIFLANRQSSGALYIGSGLVGESGARSQAINIGTAPSNSGSINIGSGTNASGSINIANGGGTAGTSNIAVNISTGITTGAVTIGNSANSIALNSATVTLARPLTLGTGATANTQLGFRSASLITSTAFVATVAGTAYDAKSFSFPATGVWFFELRCRSTTASTNIQVSVSTTSATISYANNTIQVNNVAGGMSASLTGTVSTTSSAVWYVIVQSTTASANFQDFYLFATRVG